MTTEQTTVALALQSALNPTRFQLDIAASKVEGVALTSVNAAIAMVNQIEELVLEQYNKEVDDYNTLCDTLEDTDSDLKKATADLVALTGSIDAINTAAQQKVLAGEKDMVAAKLHHSKSLDMQTELKRLKAMEPEKLKVRVSELRKKVDDQRKLLDQQRLSIRTLKNELNESEIQRVALVGKMTAMEDELKELRGRLLHHDGDSEQRVYHGKDGLEMYLFTFEWGLKFRPASSQIKLINDINWHMEIRTNYGICVLVSVTEWLTPFYPPCDYLADRWDTEIHDSLVEIIESRLELSHSHLIARAEWAKESYLEDAGLLDKHVDALNAAGFHSLYSVMHVPSEKLLNMVKAASGKDQSVKGKTKGFGEAAVRQVRKQVEKLVAEWEKNSGEWQPVATVSPIRKVA